MDVSGKTRVRMRGEFVPGEKMDEDERVSTQEILNYHPSTLVLSGPEQEPFSMHSSLTALFRRSKALYCSSEKRL